ncbi:MAG: DUF3365 domain-containing protein [Planctomycetaceae bacterium]|nr:DUF3365 domain-containing protein [Planctomycetaceae bacterium]
MFLPQRLAAFVIPCFVVMVGCSANTETKSTSSKAKTDNAQSPFGNVDPNDQKKFLAAKDALFTKLSGKLIQTMSEQGPVAAIAICNQEAPQIAASVAEENSVQIGRIGVRLRNPKNVTPDWAEAWVAAKSDSPKFLQLADGKSAALFPIKLQATCLMCHGPKNQIAADVLAEIGKLYPDDQATGFSEGELRGWVWVISN